MNKEIDKQYIKIMIMNYVGQLIKENKEKQANYTIQAEKDIVNIIWDNLKPTLFNEFNYNSNLSISKIKFNIINKYCFLDSITIHKDNEFLTNIYY